MKDNRIRPADRVSTIEEYYFSRRLKEVAQLRAEGKRIVSLGIGGPDMPPSHEAVETLCVAAMDPHNHSYQPGNGIPQLRNAFADWYWRWYGVKLDPNTELQPLIGSKEGILHVSLTFLNPGDGVLVPNPGYPTYTSASRLALAKIYPYDLTAENGWQPDFDALERLPLDEIKLMWVNYPHMPTGAPASMELFEKLVDFGRRHNIVIAHDNPYSFILNPEPKSILQVEGAKEVCVEMNSLSKCQNMAGWRIGMVASNPEFIKWIVKVKSNVDSGQFKPMMLAAAKALEGGEEWYDRLNEEYRRRRTLGEEVMRLLGCEFDRNQTGMFLWGRIPDDVPSGEWLADRLLYDLGLFIAPGFIFGSNGDRYIRISLCAPEGSIKEAIGRLQRYNKIKI